MSAIAHSLRMPFETARRRIQALVKVGALQATSKGILVSQQSLGDQAFLANVMIRHELLKAFYYEMQALGVPPPSPPGPPGPPPASDAPPIRLTNRLIWEYMLRVADHLGSAVGDATNGVILLAMIRENTRGFSMAELAAWARDPRRLGRPVRNGRLAGQLNFSTETLRRYVIALEGRGFCMRGKLGLIAVAPSGIREILDRMVLDNLANVQRMLGRLRQYGILSAWDAPIALAAGQ